MRLNKRGISPLIATVLIIGFTIVLGAMVMQWGSAFFKQTTEQTSKTSEAQLGCTQVNFNIDSAAVSATPTGVDVQVTNKVDTAIPLFIARLVEADGTVVVNDSMSWANSATQLGPFETRKSTILFTGATPAKGNTIELIPKVKVGTDIVACSADYKQTATL